MENIYKELLKEYYGISCCNNANSTNAFWVNELIKKLNILGECQTNLQTLFQ